MTPTTKPISPLRQRMLDDMRMRKLSEKTQSHYIRAVVNFTRFLRRAPDTATATARNGRTPRPNSPRLTQAPKRKSLAQYWARPY